MLPERARPEFILQAPGESAATAGPRAGVPTGAHGSVVAVEVLDVTHSFRLSQREATVVLAVQGVTFSVPAGQFLAVVGPSGCGKTTILNLIAGLTRPDRGSVHRYGVRVNRTDPAVAYMWARSALMPWLTARDNAAFGLRLRGVGRQDRHAVADAWLERLGLGRFRDAYPAQLSQGMQQRVAIARTLAIDPAIILLDEPFGALDAHTRLAVQAEFLGVWEGSGKTVVFVTHDLGEAVALADRVIVFTSRPGRVKCDVRVALPRPRVVAEARCDERFTATYERIWRELRDEFLGDR